MGGLIAAWLVGEGIIIYRSVKNQKIPPGPGQLLISSGIFVLLGLLAESPKARPLAVTLAWGFDIAAFMNLFGTGGTTTPSKVTWPPALASNAVVFPNGTGTASGQVAGVVQQGLTAPLLGSVAGNAANSAGQDTTTQRILGFK